MKICPKCHASVEDDANFCMNCGTKVDYNEEKRFCAQCGEQVSNEALFCPECGAQLRSGKLSSFPKFKLQDQLCH